MGRWIALLGAVVLSACSTAPRVIPQPVTPPPASRPQPVKPAPTVEAGIPQDTERNRIALLVPLNGPNAGVGQSIANATQLAQLDTSSNRIRITNYDTTTGAAAAAQRAIADGAQLILGPLLAEDARAVAPIAKRAGVPVISFTNDASVATDGVYTLGYAPAQSIQRVVGFARERGVTSFAGMMPSGLYGERASTAFLRAVEGAGGSVLTLQNFDRTPGAITAAVGRMNASAPFDAVLIADSGATTAAAAPLLRKSSPATHLLGTELWNTENGLSARPALAGAWFASVSNNLYRQYATKYRARFGVGPYRLSSLGYDAVLLTVRIARDWRAGAPFPLDRLTDPDGFVGIDGAFRFGRDHVAERALEVQEVRAGGAVTVSPAPSGFGR